MMKKIQILWVMLLLLFLAGCEDYQVEGPTPTEIAGMIPGQFSVDRNGMATYKIPIQVPPGITGMNPKLALTYKSSNKNGKLGLGWTLGGISTIETRAPGPSQ